MRPWKRNMKRIIKKKNKTYKAWHQCRVDSPNPEKAGWGSRADGDCYQKPSAICRQGGSPSPFLSCTSFWSVGDGLEDPVQCLDKDLICRSAHIHPDDIDLVASRRLQDVELAVDHIGAHVVVLTGEDPL